MGLGRTRYIWERIGIQGWIQESVLTLRDQAFGIAGGLRLSVCPSSVTRIPILFQYSKHASAPD